ncbi:MAG TPA: GNAT family N-acetyltransferase [Stellaceae bacterium]|nr:GNAT family N-acetyltransferase [Stellaceae bacterium]
MTELRTDAVTIREALPADAPALVDVIMTINEETEFLGTSEDRPTWAEHPEEGLGEMRERGTGVYFIAVEGGEIVGFLGAFPGNFARTRSIVYVAHVGVRTARRGRGIGPRLFAAVEAWARGRDARRLELRVDVANPRALALYRRAGYEIEGRLPDASLIDGAWHDHYWMSKPLTPELEPRWAPLDLRPPSPRALVGEVTIRALEPGDAARLRSWERTMLGDGPFYVKQIHEQAAVAQIEKEIAESARNPRHFVRGAFVGEAGHERLLGHAGAWFDPWSRSRHDGWVNVNVLREASGLGIGRRLWAGVEAWARENGARRLTGAVQAHNVRGLAFAEAAGLRREALARNYVVIDDRSADRVRLGKVLA